MIFSRRKTESGNLDKVSIGVLYDKHAPWLLALCLRYTGNREDAEDVLHDGFMKIIRGIGKFREQETGSLEAWMRRIIVNTALNYIRDHKKEKMFAEPVLLSEPVQVENDDNDEIAGYDFSREQLNSFICELPAGYRTVFNLYVMEDYSHKEIAGMLGISENTSKSQLSKARNYLRRRLREYQNILNYAKAGTN